VDRVLVAGVHGDALGFPPGNAAVDDRGAALLALGDVHPLGFEAQIGEFLRRLREDRKRDAALHLQVVAERLVAVVLGHLVLDELAREQAPQTRLARAAHGGIAGDGDSGMDEHLGYSRAPSRLPTLDGSLRPGGANKPNAGLSPCFPTAISSTPATSPTCSSTHSSRGS
jgi:hypothetical protein